MRDVKIKKYLKKLEYSYAIGIHPTLDLVKYKPAQVIKVLIHTKGIDSDTVQEIISLCNKENTRYEMNDSLVDKLSVKENTFAIGIFMKYEEELDPKCNHIVLDQPRNMGNVGTIIRTMVGFGFKDLALIRPAADIFDPTIVRSAMGALFISRFKYFDSFEEYVNVYKEHNKYLFMLKGAKDISTVEFKKTFSLVLGNEGQGLPDEYSKYGTTVYIPQSNEIDSLNLSIAAGIGMYISTRAVV